MAGGIAWLDKQTSYKDEEGLSCFTIPFSRSCEITLRASPLHAASSELVITSLRLPLAPFDIMVG
jgi:hypothetical protein